MLPVLKWLNVVSLVLPLVVSLFNRRRKLGGEIPPPAVFPEEDPGALLRTPRSAKKRRKV